MLQGKGPKSKNPPNLDSKKLNKYSSFTDYGKVWAQTSSLVGASMLLTVVVMAIIYSLQNYQLMFFFIIE
jgi:hypothetical protein